MGLPESLGELHLPLAGQEVLPGWQSCLNGEASCTLVASFDSSPFR